MGFLWKILQKKTFENFPRHSFMDSLKILPKNHSKVLSMVCFINATRDSTWNFTFFFSKFFFRTSFMNCPKLSQGMLSLLRGFFGRYLKISSNKSFKNIALVSSVCSLWVSLENSAGIPSEILFGLHPVKKSYCFFKKFSQELS